MGMIFRDKCGRQPRPLGGYLMDTQPARSPSAPAGYLARGYNIAKEKKNTHTHFLSDLTHGLQAGLFEFSRFWFGKHIGPKFGDGSQPFPWIHLDDLLGIRICGYVTTHARTRRRTILLDTKVTFALENPSVRGVLNAVAPQIITNDEYAQVCTHPFSEKKKSLCAHVHTHTHPTQICMHLDDNLSFHRLSLQQLVKERLFAFRRLF